MVGTEIFVVPASSVHLVNPQRNWEMVRDGEI